MTDVIELAVGAVCLAAAAATWRRHAVLASILLSVAGLTAVGHALWSLAT